ncbi:MAG: L-histidine N(alpha)-methyltransferase [Planctomycetes bacterium]|nr:L-histidine N(alpha)-methyltransferase [Planctomycetota bacterium]
MGKLIPTQLDVPAMEPAHYGDRLKVFSVAAPDAVDAFADDVREGLGKPQKSLPAKYLYDKTGSRLFEKICELPEYYLTRTEEEILSTHAERIVEATGEAAVLTELGAGSSAKTAHLIDKFVAARPHFTYNPIDISEEMIRLGARRLLGRYPQLHIYAMICEYGVGLSELNDFVPESKVIVFLGSSLGNFTPKESTAFLRKVARTLNNGDSVLIGIDMAKDPQIIHRAYDDAAGVTARFNKNVLTRINRRFGADFDLEAFGHVARYDPDRGCVEMHLVSRENQSVTIRDLNMSVDFKIGESIHTEYSHKFTPQGFEAISRRAGLRPVEIWSDRKDWFRLILLKERAA